jgi:hypothetical protein
MRPQNDPRNAIAVSGDESTGDGGTGWVGGCAAMLLVLVGSAATVIALLRAVIA